MLWVRIFIRLAFIGILLLTQIVAFASPSVGLGYTPKYPNNFKHFDYVNPDAPKGGQIILPGFGNFDSFNPYILKGVSVEGLSDLVFETLMVQSSDEPYSLYSHIANDITLAKDQLSVTFKINPLAHFSDGSPILANDVKISFDTIKSDKGHPSYRFYWADIKQAVVINNRTIRFEFARHNPELHLIAAQIPVFSHKWIEGEDFDKLSRKQPIGSGPYTIEKYTLGKDITYKRNLNYWAKDLPTRRGMFNFDKVIFKYYKDETVMLEALKAGEFDFKLVNHSKKWARDYIGEKFDSKKIIKE